MLRGGGLGGGVARAARLLHCAALRRPPGLQALAPIHVPHGLQHAHKRGGGLAPSLAFSHLLAVSPHDVFEVVVPGGLCSHRCPQLNRALGAPRGEQWIIGVGSHGVDRGAAPFEHTDDSACFRVPDEDVAVLRSRHNILRPRAQQRDLLHRGNVPVAGVALQEERPAGALAQLQRVAAQLHSRVLEHDPSSAGAPDPSPPPPAADRVEQPALLQRSRRGSRPEAQADGAGVQGYPRRRRPVLRAGTPACSSITASCACCARGCSGLVGKQALLQAGHERGAGGPRRRGSPISGPAAGAAALGAASAANGPRRRRGHHPREGCAARRTLRRPRPLPLPGGLGPAAARPIGARGLSDPFSGRSCRQVPVRGASGEGARRRACGRPLGCILSASPEQHQPPLSVAMPGAGRGSAALARHRPAAHRAGTFPPGKSSLRQKVVLDIEWRVWKKGLPGVEHHGLDARRGLLEPMRRQPPAPELQLGSPHARVGHALERMLFRVERVDAVSAEARKEAPPVEGEGKRRRDVPDARLPRPSSGAAGPEVAANPPWPRAGALGHLRAGPEHAPIVEPYEAGGAAGGKDVGT
mmetsp:Transcript_15643/g.37168  ORF Transcript_15643/g.37168 Transcript_15643/m.37168 type:complete len:583 (+) Transcript_15643:150-1898(+)